MTYTLSKKAIEARRSGGHAVLAKYGPDHMAKLGKKGAKAFHKKYKLVPAGIGNYAIVDRQTGQVVNTLAGNF